MKTSDIPSIIYGTAWKEDRTGALVAEALSAGFRGIDTANQKKHYREDFTGETLKEWVGPKLRREELFLQSKYTYQRGQDDRLPYDPKSTFAEQVAASFDGTLKNLNTTYIDSYLIHGPSSMDGLTDADWEVWTKMEELYDEEKALRIGVSNVFIHHLEELFEGAKVKPTVVQNRCYTSRGWDEEVRSFCLENQIVYQGFSLLTANAPIVSSETVKTISERFEVTPSQIVLRFATQIGILPLTGTTNSTHMKQDLNIFSFELEGKDVASIMNLSR